VDKKSFLNIRPGSEAQAVIKNLSHQQSKMGTWLLSVSKPARKLHKRQLILTHRPKSPHNNNSHRLLQLISQTFKSSHSKITLSKISEALRPIKNLQPLILALLHLQRCLDKEVTTITILRSSPRCKKQNNANKRSR